MSDIIESVFVRAFKAGASTFLCCVIAVIIGATGFSGKEPVSGTAIIVALCWCSFSAVATIYNVAKSTN